MLVQETRKTTESGTIFDFRLLHAYDSDYCWIYGEGGLNLHPPPRISPILTSSFHPFKTLKFLVLLQMTESHACWFSEKSNKHLRFSRTSFCFIIPPIAIRMQDLLILLIHCSFSRLLMICTNNSWKETVITSKTQQISTHYQLTTTSQRYHQTTPSPSTP